MTTPRASWYHNALLAVVLAMFFFPLSHDSYGQSSAVVVDHNPIYSGPDMLGCYGIDKSKVSGYGKSSIGRNNHIISNFITCIRGTIQGFAYSGSNSIIGVLSLYMVPIVAALSTLAIVVHGIKILGGEGEARANTARLLLRIVLVNFFFINMGGLAAQPFYVMDELAGTLAQDPSGNAWTPWDPLDYIFGNLIGYDHAADPGNADYDPTQDDTMKLFDGSHSKPKYTLLKHGALAMLAAAAFAGHTGFLLTAIGMMALLQIVFLILDIAYVYLLSVMVIALCVMISPLMIPLAIFQYSDRYFSKWLSTMLGAILIPGMLFCFLNIAVVHVFHDQVQTLLQSLNPALHHDDDTVFTDEIDGHRFTKDNYVPYPREEQWLGTWVQQVASSLQKTVSDAVRNAPGFLAYWIFGGNPAENSKTQNNTVAGKMKVWALNMANFGGNSEHNIVQAIFAALKLFVFGFVMLGLVKKLPAIAQEIAGAATSINIQSKSVSARVSESVENFKMGSGMLIGGLTGREIGGAIDKTVAGKNRGSEVGALIGGLVGKRV